jgi:hypothetical protein
MPEPVRILDWYRPDTSARVRRILLVAPGLMSFGGLVIAVSFITRQPERVRVDAAALGFVLIAGSSVFTAATMFRILREDGSLALRTDGVVVQSAGRETLVGWSDLEAARWDASRKALILDRKGADPLVVAWSFAGISGPALAERLERDRLKAAMGLLR